MGVESVVIWFVATADMHFVPSIDTIRIIYTYTLTCMHMTQISDDVLMSEYVTTPSFTLTNTTSLVRITTLQLTKHNYGK